MKLIWDFKQKELLDSRAFIVYYTRRVAYYVICCYYFQRRSASAWRRPCGLRAVNIVESIFVKMQLSRVLIFLEVIYRWLFMGKSISKMIRYIF